MTVHPWNRLISALPDPHLLQTWEWGQVKSRFGWQAIPLIWDQAGKMVKAGSPIDAAQHTMHNISAAALLLQRDLTIRGFATRIRVMYIPKGPLLDWSNVSLRNRVLENLGTFARQKGSIFIKIDPDLPLGQGIPDQPGSQEINLGQQVMTDLIKHGWSFSGEQVQFRNTLLVDLSLSEEEILNRMKPKARYNIRLAERKGVTVRIGNHADLPLLYRMYAETSLRDGFVIRAEEYYKRVWGLFINNLGEFNPSPDIPVAEPLIAEVDREPVAAVVIYRFAGKAWYLYGMSREIHREKMPNHLLQWEAIRRAKTAGCKIYDLWGAPDVFNENDPLWGVYRFKEGFGGSVYRTIGAWDLPSRKIWYQLYTSILPRLLDKMRHRGQIQTKHNLGV